MTLEQALAKVTDPEAKATLQKIISDQNSYITNLEKQVKEAAGKNSSSGLDPATQKYLEQNMRKDTINSAKELLLKDVSSEVFNAVEADWLEFLKTVETKNFTLEYIMNAFELTLGKCLRKKDHPVHSIGKSPSPQAATPTNIQAGSNAQAINGVQDAFRQPPVLRDNFGGGEPNTGTPVTNTRDAFARFKGKLSSGGQL